MKWSITEFYSRAWNVTMTHKKLWILGLAVTLYASGGGSMRMPSGGGSSDSNQDVTNTRQMEKSTRQVQRYTTSNQNTAVLDELNDEKFSTDENEDSSDTTEQEEFVKQTFQPVVLGLQRAFASVPVMIFVLIAVQFLIIAGVFVVLSWSTSVWAVAALVQAVADATDKDTLNLKQAAHHALTRIKSLIWLSIVPLIGVIAAVIIGMIVGGVAIAIKPWIGVITIIGLIVGGIYGLIRLSVTNIWAVRYCVLDSLSGSDAFNQGWKTAGGTIGKTLRLGLANSLVSMLITGLVFAPFIVAAVSLALKFTATNHFPVGDAVSVGVLFLITVIISSGIQAILTVFKYVAWHLGFTVVKQK